jgi:Fur family zinc uptake transcriptional regulator
VATAGGGQAGPAAQMTELRRTVLSLLVSAGRPQTAYQLLDRLRAVWPGATPMTVYRSLEFLREQGLIHKLERSNTFFACVEAGHHANVVQLLVCQNCGLVAELEDDSVSQALFNAAALKGFRPLSRHIEIDGLCAGCANPRQ